jgi:hypothetical protein
MASPNYKIGDKVVKKIGYRFPGIVVGANLIPACSGGTYYWRYDVLAATKDFQGMLHIFSAEQLQPRIEPRELDEEILAVLKAQGLLA